MIDSDLVIALNFVGDCCTCSILVILYLTSILPIQFDFTSCMYMLSGGVMNVLSEGFLFLGIESGIVGPVVSIAGSNCIFVTLLNLLIDHILLSSM